MPRGDRTGPYGMGPMTGRAAGYCAGAGVPGFMNPAFGRGRGLGFGRSRGFWNQGFGCGGFGRRNRYFAADLRGWGRPGSSADPFVKPDPEWEKQALRAQAEDARAELQAIEKRLSELETEDEGGTRKS